MSPSNDDEQGVGARPVRDRGAAAAARNGELALADTLRPEQDPALAHTLPPEPGQDPALADTLRPPSAGTARPNPATDATLAPELGEPSAMGATLLPTEASLSPSALPSRVSIRGEFPVANWERYEFLQLLGQGGMGAVYKARDKRLGRIVALKFIRGGDPNMVMRFVQEARAQARIDHPHVCKVYEVGEVEGKAYIAMQFVDGKSLDRAAPTLSLTERVVVMRQVAEAMHEAHRLGIIHRDLKPAKILPDEKAEILSPVSSEHPGEKGSGYLGPLAPPTPQPPVDPDRAPEALVVARAALGCASATC